MAALIAKSSFGTYDKPKPLSVLFILLGVSLFVAAGFLIAFLWSTSTGQYDDDYTPSVRMLFDNELKQTEQLKKENI